MLRFKYLTEIEFGVDNGIFKLGSPGRDLPSENQIGGERQMRAINLLIFREM
jgi:hypothetical protein